MEAAGGGHDYHDLEPPDKERLDRMTGDIKLNSSAPRYQESFTFITTRTKTSIRYAKENDREKRERKKGRRRDIEREGEIRERERVM